MKLTDYLEGIGKERFAKQFDKNEALPPFKVKFKITNKCNLKCQKCNYWKGIDIIEPSFEQISATLDQIGATSCKKLKFSGGEVVMRDDLYKIISYAKSKNIEKLSITTNGTLINAEKARQLIDSGLDQINISIDMAEEHSYDDLVGVDGAWKKTIGAFHAINEASKKMNRKISLVMQSVVCKENYSNLDSILQMAYDLNVRKLSLLSYNSRHLDNKSLALTNQEIGEFNFRIFPEISRKADELGIEIINPAYYAIAKLRNQKITCYSPWLSYYISPKLKVYACCASKQSEFYLGTLSKNTLDSIRNSGKYKQFREKSKLSPNPTCLGCMNNLNENVTINEWLKNGAKN